MDAPHHTQRALVAVVAALVLMSGCGGDPAREIVVIPLEEPAPDPAPSYRLPMAHRGLAYPVPSTPIPGPHVNDVRVELRDENGTAVGEEFLPAGTPVEVVPSFAKDGSVEVILPGEFTAIGARDDFWRIPDIVDFKDITVELEGATVPVGDSGLDYHRVGAGGFDDPDTPDYDAIASRIRRFLSCEEDSWKIANQYFAADVIQSGLDRNDPSLIEQGVAGLDWGVAQELDVDGVFSLYRECDDTTVSDPGETHHSSQWLAAIGRGVYLLAASPYAGEYRAQIDSYIAHIETLAGHLAREDVRLHWVKRWLYEENGDAFTHKFYMRAAGLGLAASLTDDRAAAADWATQARTIAEEGIATQRADGANTERGGHDVRYQMYGTWLAEVYQTVLDDGAHRDAVRGMIDGSIDWMLTRVDPETGAVNIEGSTRTCVIEGTSDDFHPYHTLSVLLFWALDEPDRDALAETAVAIDAAHDRGENPCP